MKQFFLPQYIAGIVLLSTSSMFGMFQQIGHELDAMHSRMEIVFEELTERTQARKITAPDYSPVVREEDGSILISVNLAKNITSDAILVEVDEDILEVVVQSRDRLELLISGQRMNILAQQNLEHEAQDEHGHVYAVSSGSSCMSQSRMLPARVDVTVAPKADLADGVLTLTLAKKGPQKIAVTTSATAKDSGSNNMSNVVAKTAEQSGPVSENTVDALDEQLDIEDLK